MLFVSEVTSVKLEIPFWVWTDYDLKITPGNEIHSAAIVKTMLSGLKIRVVDLSACIHS